MQPVDAPKLLATLDELAIVHATIRHDPAPTVESWRAVRGDLPGANAKNLFVRNKKGRMWLLTCLEDRAFNLNLLGKSLGTGRLSFASHDRLRTYLGIEPGSVSPLAAINDRAQQVTILLDAAMQTMPQINVHPLDNRMTTSLSPADLERFLVHTGHTPEWVDLEDAPTG